ncbi:hypothetical protein AVEN_212810-1, partial [Araneus ventricosus]
VENFSALKLGERKILQIPSHSKTGCVISSSLSVCNTLAGNDPVIVGIVPSDSNYILCRKKLSLLYESGNTKECGEVDYRFLDVGTDIQKLERQLTRQLLLNKKWEYLPNDELSLLCECTFSTGAEHAKIEEIIYKIPLAAYNQKYHNAMGKNGNEAAEHLSSRLSPSADMEVNHNNQCLINMKLKANTFSAYNVAPSTTPSVPLNQMTNNDPNKIIYNAAEKLSMCPSVQDDFTALYNDQLLTDVVLKTSTKSFPAHKIVLCARSSVFRAMLTNEMKEKITD